MPYVTPTASQLKSRFPAFTDVDDTIIDQAVIEANRFVDDSWAEEDYQIAIMLLACHIMTLDGLGTGAQAQVYAQGMSGYQSIRSGAFSLTRENGFSTTGWATTTYGQRFLAYLKMNRGGPLVTGSGCRERSYQATDWPMQPPWVY